MPYVTSIETNAYRRSVVDILQQRFGSISEATKHDLDWIQDGELMRRLVVAASTISTPAEFEKLLPKTRRARQKDA